MLELENQEGWVNLSWHANFLYPSW